MNQLQLQHYFEILIQSVATIYMTICLLMAFFKSPKGDTYLPYRQSKRMLTAAYASMSTNLFAWCILTTGNWAKFNFAIASIDIILFYVEEMLLCYSFCNILNNSFLTRRRIVKDTVQMGISAILALAALVPLMAEWRLTFLMVALAAMLENIGELAYLFYKQYRRNGEMLDNYFSNDMRSFVRWTSLSITLLIISWVFALVTMFTNVYVNWAFQIYMVSLNLFIAVRFINFAPQYGNIARAYQSGGITVADDNEIRTTSSNSDAVKNTLQQKIAAWVDSKGYLGSQFTIDELATRLGTNKNYLSYFINERYGMNFSAWVSSLRVESAKKIMVAHPGMKLEEIAYTVGFSSPSYFSKVFAYHEGISPTMWRRNMQK